MNGLEWAWWCLRIVVETFKVMETVSRRTGDIRYNSGLYKIRGWVRYGVDGENKKGDWDQRF